MKWYSWTIVGMLVACLIALYFYDLSTINTLKSRISSIQPVRDTFYVKGTIDTVFIRKTHRDTLIAYNKMPIDTSLEIDNHTVDLFSNDSLLAIGLECRQPEILITKVDTLYKTQIEYKERIEYNTNWKSLGYVSLAGMLVGTIITLLSNK